MSRSVRRAPSILAAGVATLALALSAAIVPVMSADADTTYPSQLPAVAISGGLHEGTNVVTLVASDGYQTRTYITNYYHYNSDPVVSKLERNHWRAVITDSSSGFTPTIETGVSSATFPAELEMRPVDQPACQAATSAPDVYSESCDWQVIVPAGMPSFHGSFSTGCYSGSLDTGAEHHGPDDYVPSAQWNPDPGPGGCRTASVPIDYTGTATPPTAAFSASFTGAHAWSFDASASTAASGRSVASYRWTFGDGQAATTTTPTTTHSYSDGTPHTASLVVVDSAGTASVSVDRQLTEPALVVNSTGDAPATSPSNGCDTGGTIGTPAVPECTLRAAIQALDAGVGGTKISFALPSGSTTITAASALPDITKAGAIVDGTEDSGMPTISGSPLHVTNASGVTITKVSVIGSGDLGVYFENSPGATLTSSSIGISPAGVVSAPKFAVQIESSGVVTVGGAGAGNVIAATQNGLVISGTAAISSLTVRGNAVGVRADGTLIPGSGSIGVAVFAGTAAPTTEAMIADNRIAGFSTVNLSLAGAGLTAPHITGNRLGVAADQDTLLGAARSNLRLDGVGGAVVSGNQLAGAAEDVLVSGSLQVSIDPSPAGAGMVLIHYRYPGGTDTEAPLPGSTTGTHDTISGNQIGPVGRHDGANLAVGIDVWNLADDTTISGNTVQGHDSREIQVTGTGARLAVTGNSIGDLSGTSGPEIGVDLQGMPSPAVSNNSVGGVFSGIQLARDTGAAVVSGNTVGFGANGSAAAPVAIGIDVGGTGTTVGPGNTVGNASRAGIYLEGPGSTAISNRVGAAKFGSSAAPNAIGIVVPARATGALIGGSGAGNTIVGNGTGLQVLGSGAEVAANTFGVITSGALGNGTAIDVRAAASVHDNTIANSSVVGVKVASGVATKLLHNVIYGTTGGVGVTGARTAPTILEADQVLHGSSARTFLVIRGVPTTTGTIEVFGNPSCADPEGRVPLFTTSTTSESTRVLSVADRTDLSGLTVMVTTTAGTSVISDCVPSAAGVDTDGDGIPDRVEAAYPGGTFPATSPKSAAFVADNQTWVALSTEQGTLSNVSPIDDPDPSGHPGATFPLGLIDWTVTGIDPGSSARVTFSLPGTVINGWWKYSSRHSPAFFDFAYSSIAGYGATVTSANSPFFGLSTNVLLTVPDGGVGDDDGLENGSVRDPSAPAVVAGGPAGPAASAVAAPTFRSTALARTGSDPTDGLIPGLIALMLGAALVTARAVSRRRSTR